MVKNRYKSNPAREGERENAVHRMVSHYTSPTIHVADAYRWAAIGKGRVPRGVSWEHGWNRVSIGSHAFGALAIAVYLIVVGAGYANEEPRRPYGLLRAANMVSATLTSVLLAASATFHLLRSHVRTSAFLQTIDAALTFATVGIGSAADLVVASMAHAPCDAPGMPDFVVWQAPLDAVLLAGLSVAYLLVTRLAHAPSRTWRVHGHQHTERRDTRHHVHSFGSFSTTLYVLLGVCVLQWICSAPFEVRALGAYGSAIVSVKAASVALAVLSGCNDLVEITDSCTARRCPSVIARFVPQAHTLWHFVSMFALVASIVARAAATSSLESSCR